MLSSEKHVRRISLEGDDQIVKISPRRKEYLTKEQLQYIQKVLDKSCVGKNCISKEKLFEAVRRPLNLKIELYRFEQEITKAIRDQALVGFHIRVGRNGGICKETKESCKILIDNSVYKISERPDNVLKLLRTMLSIKPDKKGDIKIENILYSIPHDTTAKLVLINYLSKILEAENV